MIRMQFFNQIRIVSIPISCNGGYTHSHTFKIEVKVEVEHNDREVEFFMFQRDVDNAIRGCYIDCEEDVSTDDVGYRFIETFISLGRKSCEEIAEDIYNELLVQYPRPMIISVSEDGNVAAEIEFEPEEQ